MMVLHKQYVIPNNYKKYLREISSRRKHTCDVVIYKIIKIAAQYESQTKILR